MTQITQEQQDASQATVAQVAAKFQGFCAALSEDEQQVLASALATVGQVAGGAARGLTGADDVAGHIWPFFVGVAAGVAANAIYDLATDGSNPDILEDLERRWGGKHPY